MKKATFVEIMHNIRSEIISVMRVDVPHPVWRVRSFSKDIFSEMEMDKNFPEWIALSIKVYLSNGMVEDIFFSIAVYLHQVRVGFVIGDWINDRISQYIQEPVRSTWTPSVVRESSPGRILFDYEFSLDPALWTGCMEHPEYLAGIGRSIGAYCRDVWMHLFISMARSGFVPSNGKIYDVGDDSTCHMLKIHVKDVAYIDALKSILLDDQDLFIDNVMSACDFGDEDGNNVYISIVSLTYDRIIEILDGLDYVEYVENVSESSAD